MSFKRILIILGKVARDMGKKVLISLGVLLWLTTWIGVILIPPTIGIMLFSETPLSGRFTGIGYMLLWFGLYAVWLVTVLSLRDSILNAIKSTPPQKKKSE